MASIGSIEGTIRIQDQFSAVFGKFSADLKKLDAEARSLGATSKTASGGLTGMGSSAGSASGGFLALQATIAALGLTSLIRNLVETRIAFDSMQNVMRAVTGDSALAAEEYQFVRDTAMRLGFDLRVLAGSYAQLMAATKGTALEGQATREVFRSVSEASRVLGLDTRRTELAFLAIQQMASKGVVSMEELRRQLGDQIPGAVNMTAKELGYASNQLKKFYDEVKKGAVPSVDAILALQRGLDSVFGSQVQAAMRQTAAEVGRFKTVLFEASEVASKGFEAGFLEGVSGLRKALSADEFKAAAFALGNDLGNAVRVLAEGVTVLVENFTRLKLITIAYLEIRLGVALLQYAVHLGVFAAALGTATVATEAQKLAQIKLNVALAAAPYLALVALVTALRIGLEDLVVQTQRELEAMVSADRVGKVWRDQLVELRGATKALTAEEWKHVQAIGASMVANQKRLEVELAAAQAANAGIKKRRAGGGIGALVTDADLLALDAEKNLENRINIIRGTIEGLGKELRRLGVESGADLTETVDIAKKMNDEYESQLHKVKELHDAHKRNLITATLYNEAIKKIPKNIVDDYFATLEKGHTRARRNADQFIAKLRQVAESEALVTEAARFGEAAMNAATETLEGRKRVLEIVQQAQDGGIILSKTEIATVEKLASAIQHEKNERELNIEAYKRETKAVDKLAEIRREIGLIEQTIAARKRGLLSGNEVAEVNKVKDAWEAWNAVVEAGVFPLSQIGQLIFGLTLQSLALERASEAVSIANKHVVADAVAMRRIIAETQDELARTTAADHLGVLGKILSQYGLIGNAVRELNIQEEIRTRIIEESIDVTTKAGKARVAEIVEAVRALDTVRQSMAKILAAAEIHRHIVEPMRQAASATRDAFLDAFADIVTGADVSFTSIMHDLIRMWVRALAEMFARWVAVQVKMKAAQVAMNVSGSGGGGFNLGNLASLFGGGAGASGVAGGSSFAGFGGGGGSMMGFAGTSGAGQALSGSASGGAAAWGTVAAYAFFAGLVVKMGYDAGWWGKQGEKFFASATFGGDAGLKISDTGGTNIKNVVNRVKEILAGIQQFLQDTNIQIEKFAEVTLTKKGHTYLASAINQLGQTIVTTFETGEQAMEWATVAAIKYGVFADSVSEFMKLVITNSAAVTRDALAADIEFARMIEGLGQSELEQQTATFGAKFDDWRKRLVSLVGRNLEQLIFGLNQIVGEELRSWQGVVDNLMGTQRSPQEQLEMQRLQATLVQAQLQLRILELKGERDQLLIKAQLIKERLTLGETELKVEAEYVRGRARLLAAEGEILYAGLLVNKEVLGAQLKIIEATLAALGILIDGLQKILDSIDLSKIQIPGGGKGDDKKEREKGIADWIADRIMSRLPPLRQELARLNKEFDDEIKLAGKNKDLIAKLNAERAKEIALLAARVRADLITPFTGPRMGGQRSPFATQFGDITKQFQDLRDVAKALGIPLWQVNRAEAERLRLLGLEAAASVGSRTAATILQFEQLGQTMDFLRQHAKEMQLDFGKLVDEFRAEQFVALGDQLMGFIQKYYGDVAGFEGFRADLERTRFELELANMHLQFDMLVSMGYLTEETIAKIRGVFDFIDANPVDWPKFVAPQVQAANSLERAADESATEMERLLERLRDAKLAIKELADELARGVFGGVAPDAGFEEARRQFESVIGAAEARDLLAIENVPDATRDFLDAMKAYSPALFAVEVPKILARLRGLEGVDSAHLGNMTVSERFNQQRHDQAMGTLNRGFGDLSGHAVRQEEIQAKSVTVEEEILTQISILNGVLTRIVSQQGGMKAISIHTGTDG